MGLIVFRNCLGSINSSGSSKRSGSSAALYPCAVTRGGCWLGWRCSHTCLTGKKRLKEHSTSPHVRKGFQGERGLGEFPTHSSASGVEIVPWDTVWTKTAWILVLLPCKQVKRVPAPQNWANPHLQSQERHYLEDFGRGAPFTLGMEGIMKRTR